LAIVQELAQGERRIVDLTARLGLAQSTAEQLLEATGNAVALCPVYGAASHHRAVGA
jgi:hypothetical protein